MTTKISSDNIQSATLNTLGGPKIASIGYPGNDTAANPTGGQTITLTGSGFENGASVIINNSAVGVVTVVSSTTITFTSPALATGSYPVYVVNTNGGTAIAVPGIQYSGVPSWSTAAGTLGSVYETTVFSNTVTATGDAPITYSLFSGTLPTGASLNTANGLISGTSVATENSTTYTFTIRATDAEQQDTDRQFSLTVNPDVVTWSSPANGTSYSANVNSAISNVVMSASSAAGYAITYTANTLPTGLSITGANIAGTPTVVGNTTSLLTATAATTNRSETRTISWVVSVSNDPYFKYTTLLLNGEVGTTNVWNDDVSTNKFSITVNGDTRPTAFSPYETVYSNYFDGNGDYITSPTTTTLNLGSSDYTVEFWCYSNSLGSGSAGAMYLNYDSGIGFIHLIRHNGSVWECYYKNGTAFTTVSTTTVPINQWVHHALVRSGSTVKWYINGIERGSGTDATNYTATAYIQNGNYAGYYYDGYISNFRFVRGTAVYTAAFTPPTSPLTAIANTSLLICQSNRLIDNSTNNFTITRTGDVSVSNFGPFVETDVTTGSGYFDGTGDYLTLPNINFASNDFCVECWFYWTTNDPTSYSALFGKGTSDSSEDFCLLFKNTEFYFDWGNSSTFASRSATINTRQWYHVALARSSGIVKIFLNGVQQGADISVATISNNHTTWYIGLARSGASILFTGGYISNVRFVNGSSVYTTTFTPPTSPLTAIANTSLLTLQYRTGENNNRFIDTSGINNIITRNGNTTQGTFTPYSLTGWSNYFDGTGDYLAYGSNAAFTFGTDNFTVEAWVYIAAAADFSIFNVGSNQTGSYGLYWVGSTSKFESARYGDPAGSGRTTNTYGTNQWLHVAAVRLGAIAKLYINGVEDTGATYSMGSVTASNGESGRIWQLSAVNNGYISNLRIVKGSAVYTSNFTPPTSQLTAIANTSLLTCQSNRFIDNSANNFAITRNGDVSVQSFSPFGPAINTPTSYSGYFDGTGDYLTASANSAFNFGTGDFTIECWIFSLANQAQYAGVLCNLNTTNGFYFSFSNGSNNMGFSDYSIYYISASSVTIANNVWTHVAVTRSGTTLRMFFDGSIVGTAINNTAVLGSSTSGTAVGYNGVSHYFNGYVSNVRIVKGTAVYTGNFTPSTTPLTAIANTSLLTLQSSTFIDNSTNNFTITVNGDTKPRSFNPFGNTVTSDISYTVATVGGSMYFDGTGDYLTAADNIAYEITGDFTVEAWFYCTALPGAGLFGDIITKGASGVYQPYYIFVRDTGALVFYSSSTGSSWDVASNVSFGTIVTNAWYHVAVSRSGSSLRMFLNGALINTITNSNALTDNNRAVGIGARSDGTETFTGYISNVRIIKGTGVYTSAFVPPVSPLTPIIGTTLLLDGTNGGIIDYTSKNLLETVGDAKTSTSVVKYGSRALYFDSAGDYLTFTNNDTTKFGTGDFTIECWTYLISRVNGYPAIVSNYNSFTTGALALFAGHGSADSSKYQVASNGTFPAIQSSTSISYNAWVHLAVVRNNNTLTLYVNGTSNGTTGVTGVNYTGVGSLWYIGTTGDSIATGYIYGYIDDLRITKGYARYTTNFTPPTSALLTY